MNILIACGAMTFGPETLKYKSLGGSETAALMLAKELAKRGHRVTMFCNLPEQGQPDYSPPGTKDAEGVSYAPLKHYQEIAQTYPADLAIIVRDPSLAAMFANASKKVLWMHDIATKRGMQRAFDAMAFTIDEVWTVSEWHRQQVHAVTGYPLENILALRNGIVPVETLPMPRSKTQIIYAARPERGLENLIRPGGVMENLPEYKLVVCMYDHFPEHMRGYYEQIFARMRQMPNVEFAGPQPQKVLRQMIRDSAAYIYPTQFEETGCILARECIEQRTPFLTTRVGALPETLGECGVFFEDWIDYDSKLEPGSPEWCKQFAKFFHYEMNHRRVMNDTLAAMERRTDLYWDGVADIVEANAKPKPVKVFSRAWSLVQDGDVIAAREFIKDHCSGFARSDPSSAPIMRLWDEINGQYPFLLDPSDPKYQSMASYYDWIYTHKAGTEVSELVFKDDIISQKFNEVAEEVAKLPPGSRVLEYGCGSGHLLAGLAKKFPLLTFVGVDIAPSAVETLNLGAKLKGYKNLVAYTGSLDNGMPNPQINKPFDAVIISEVLEHVVKPWEVAQALEMGYLKKGGRFIATTPYGPWEVLTTHQPGRWHERAHIWHLDAIALDDMFRGKPNLVLRPIPLGVNSQGRAIGNSLLAYDADHTPVKPLDPLAKAARHNSRQTTIACVIAMNNEQTILKMLESIKDEVQWINVALGPSTDRTREIINEFSNKYPYVGVTIIDVPKIEPFKFGFDDARKASTKGYEAFDWFIWIDTDEYLSGSFVKYLRNNSLQGYVIPQHHFTCVPREAPPQIDRPARLLRVDAGYTVRGHIHEHFEIDDGGVGRCFMLPDVDLGHTGYVNEDVRRARFERNYQFLMWDNETPDARKLHRFLFFRDLIHVMRIAGAKGDMVTAKQKAEEAIAYYNEHWEAMTSFGSGFQMSLGYLSEVYAALGRGTEIKLMVGIGGEKSAQVEGRFENYEQLEKMIGVLLKPEFKDRSDKYW